MVSQARTRTPLTPFWGRGCALSEILSLITNHNKPVHLKVCLVVGLFFFFNLKKSLAGDLLK